VSSVARIQRHLRWATLDTAMDGYRRDATGTRR